MDGPDSTKQEEPQLKHLGFVRSTAIQTIVLVWAVYDYAKQNSGSLKPTVERVEGAVSAAVAPVYDRFKDVPDHLLAFLDIKVDVATKEFDEHAPPLAKQIVGGAHDLVLKALKVTKETLIRVETDGPREAVLYSITESVHFALIQTVGVYSKLDRLPPFHQLSKVVVPLASFLSAKYNRVISDAGGRYPVFSYVPLIPVDDIVKAYKQTVATEHSNGTALPSNGADNE